MKRNHEKIEVTSVRINKFKEPNKADVVANVSFVLNNCFLIKDVRIIKKKNKIFLGMPSRKSKSNEFYDVCHPINQSTRKYVENIVLAEYINMKEDDKHEMQKA